MLAASWRPKFHSDKMAEGHKQRLGFLLLGHDSEAAHIQNRIKNRVMIYDVILLFEYPSNLLA